MQTTATETLLKIEGLKKYFPVKQGFLGRTQSWVKAVDDVSFSIAKGQTYSLVGESGCGKTTTGRCILRLIRPTEGKIHFENSDITSVDSARMRQLRREMQIIFQDPYSSLNARQSVGSAITEGLRIHKIGTPQERQEILHQLLDTVGLPASYASRYPHEFSGGQRQRICIARALALSPQFIVCDEAVSALDVSIQAQIINLLRKLQEEHGHSYLFISHDLTVVRHISHKVGVMYLGQMMEQAETDMLFENPLHPYTRALLSAVPNIDRTRRRNRIQLSGEVPSPQNPPSGCRFHTRCPECREECKHGQIPVTEPVKGHQVKCILYS